MCWHVLAIDEYPLLGWIERVISNKFQVDVIEPSKRIFLDSDAIICLVDAELNNSTHGANVQVVDDPVELILIRRIAWECNYKLTGRL